MSQPRPVRNDPITVSIVEELLVSIVREMRSTFWRSAFSSVISEGHDFSCVLLSPNGDLAAMSEDHPGHTFPLAFAAKEILRIFDGQIEDGDIFLVNDPYICGTHLNDVALFAPRVKEGKLRLFPAIRAHWADIGGGSAGSLAGNVSSIFMEGVIIPPIKIASRGVVNQACVDLIMANVRDRADRIGDLTATIGTCQVASERLSQLEAKHGREALEAITDLILDRTEKRVLAAIAELPNGRALFENYTDNDGLTGEPQRVRVALEVKDREIHLDFTGTSAQAPGPLNGGPAMVATACFMILKSYLDPKAPVNAGCFRPLTLNIPKGTFLNAERPAAMGGAGDLRRTVESCVLGALAQIIPDRVCGDNKGSANHCYVSGFNSKTQEPFICYEYPAGGIGASNALDGDHAIRTYTEGDFNTVLPVESLEALFPARVLESGLRQDSCGDGEWRGGLGMQRKVLQQGSNLALSVLTDRVVVPPFGVGGGGSSGMGNRFTVLRDGEEIEASAIPGKITSFPLRSGDVLWMRSAGGGGYGDPIRRDPHLVLADVKAELISIDHARERYGVVIAGNQVDASATERERISIGKARCILKVRLQSVDAFARNRRVCLVSEDVAGKHGFADAQLVEYATPRGAPLRAWAKIDSALTGNVTPIGPIGAEILQLSDGGEVVLRKVYTPYSHPPLEFNDGSS